MAKNYHGLGRTKHGSFDTGNAYQRKKTHELSSHARRNKFLSGAKFTGK